MTIPPHAFFLFFLIFALASAVYKSTAAVHEFAFFKI